MPLKKISKQSAQLYFISFLIPICVYSIIILSYQFGLGEIYVNSFSYLRILMLGISSMSFTYYLRHTNQFLIVGSLHQLAFAVSYGLSTYILSQESNIKILLAYSLFPILFLCYEWMVTNRKHIPFIIGNTILLLICPAIGIPVTILLYLLSFFDLSLLKRWNLGNFLHTTCNFILSIITGCFGIVFYLAPYYVKHENYTYKGFKIIRDFPIFLSRFLPGSIPSQQFFFQNQKTDLYIGLLSITFAALFFLHKNNPLRKRIYYGIFTIILIAGLELTPFQFIFNLCIDSNQETIVFSCILVFWLLRLASEGYSYLGLTKKSTILISTGIIAAIIMISWCFGSHNFLSWMLIIHIIMLGIILLSLLQIGNIDLSAIKKFLFGFLLIELCFNTMVSTNFKMRPKHVSVKAAFFYQKDADKKQKNAEKKEQASKNYQDFINEHTNKKTNELLNELYEYSQSQNVPESALANYFELCNTYTHALGITDDLFTACDDIDIIFPDHPVYQIIDLGHQIYHITCHNKRDIVPGYIPYTIHTKDSPKDPIYLWSNSNYDIIETDDALLSGKQPAYLEVADSDVASFKYQILCYSMNTTVLNQISSMLSSVDPVEESAPPSYIVYDIIGLAVSYVGAMILLLLLFYNEKQKIYRKLYHIRQSLSKATLPQRIALHFHENRIYYLAFLLPSILLLCIYVSTDCMPFGANSIFDEDGTALVFPEYLDYHYNTLKQNTYLSMHAGYATNNYNNTPLIKLYQLYQYLTPSQIIILQHLILLVCIGLAGVTMVFYLTHRQNKPISKHNPCLLLPAMVYSVNSYMLRCHSFNSWYYVYLLFPILIIAFQQLFYRRKWFTYTTLLACSIILNIQLGLYVCIFLIIYFFCQPFQGIKDLIRKGICFTWTSLLAAGCSLFVITNTIIVSQNGGYQKTDAKFPTLGLHGNFLTEWKNYMICSPVNFVSNHDGDLFAYCGIITLLLCIIFFINNNISWSEKIRKAIPILFLTISFNGKVLSYLWNGFHYQSNVPNRYTFLLMFLFAEIAFDAIYMIPHLTRCSYTYLIIGITTFFLCCQSYAGGNTTTAFVLTILFCILYLFLSLWQWHKPKAKKHIYISSLLFLAVLELYCNGIYTGKHWGVTSLMRYSDYETLIDDTIESSNNNTNFYRSSFPLKFLLNAGKAFHTYSGTAFNSYVSKYQGVLNTSYGFLSGSNYICNYYISNPMGLALSSNKYIFIQSYNSKTIANLRPYQYLGFYDGFYIFENPYYLSLGFQVPESALHYNEKNKNILTKTPLLYQNYLAKEFLNTDENLNAIHPIKVSYTATDQADRFYFTDEYNHTLTIDELNERYEKLEVYDEYKLKMHINYSVPSDGYLYLYANEIIGLDYVHKGDVYRTTIDLPDLEYALSESYYLSVFKENVFQNFYDNASQNQLENITIKNDTITGTSDYDEDGYTMLSIPYDKGWTAYIDGKEATIENPYDAGIYVKTPAGKHTLTLKFVPYGMKISQLITLGFWILTIILALLGKYFRKQKQSF